MARGLKFRIQKEVGLYYPCSENFDPDQHGSASLLSHMEKNSFLITRLKYSLTVQLNVIDE